MYISNIDHQKVQTLTALVNVMPGQIVSRTLAQNKAVSITVRVRQGHRNQHPRIHR